MINKTSAEMSREDLENLVAETSVDNIDTPVDTAASTPLLNDTAFEALNAKPPIAKNPWVRAGVVSGIGFVVIFSLGALFKGNMNVNPAVVADGQATEEDPAVRAESEELARLRSENAALKRNMGLASQSLNQAELDALNAEPEVVDADAATDTDTAQTDPASVSAVATRPAPAPPRSSATNTISYRAPAPRPPVQTASAPRAVRAPQSVQAVNPTPTTPTEPVDPYALRSQLSRLGTYGQPVAVANSSEPIFTESIVVSPHPSQRSPRLQTVDHRTPIRREISAQPSEDSDQYHRDVAAALGLPLSEVESSTTSTSEPVIAILPGDVFAAEIINGVSWNDGERPEIALETTEDLRAEDTVLIPAGTRMLAALVGIDAAGGASFDITQIFMDAADVDIPPGSLIIQADDGSMLRASRSEGRGANAQLNRAVWGSALNVLDNVIESDDSLIGDVAGGVGEAVLENQRDRVDAAAERQTAIERSQAQVWEIGPGEVQLFVSRYIPIGSHNEN